MHITFLLNQELEAASSLGRHFPLAKELVKLGYQVRILAPHPTFKMLTTRHFWRDGVEIFYVGQMHIHRVGNHKTYMKQSELLRAAIATMWQMLRLSVSLPTDAYQICKAQPINGLVGLIASFLRRKPVFLDSDDYEVAFNRFSARWQKLIVSGFERILPRLAQGVSTHTRFNVERNISYGVPAERVLYVPNGVDRKRFAGITEQSALALRKTLSLEGRKVILYVGNLSLTNHPVDLLLEAFRQIRQYEKSAQLLIVGGGEDYNTLRSQVVAMDIADQTLFVGRISPEEVPLYFKLADVSVEPVYDDLPARSRSPLKVFESMAVGTPVVAGDVGIRREILGEAGILVPPGDVDALSEALLTVLQDESAKQDMIKVALERRELFYWDVLVSDFEQVYHLRR